jgi:hypothetical protein
VIDQAVIELEPHEGTARACALMGKSRATLYRQQLDVVLARILPAELTGNENCSVLEAMGSIPVES